MQLYDVPVGSKILVDYGGRLQPFELRKVDGTDVYLQTLDKKVFVSYNGWQPACMGPDGMYLLTQMLGIELQGDFYDKT